MLKIHVQVVQQILSLGLSLGVFVGTFFIIAYPDPHPIIWALVRDFEAIVYRINDEDSSIYNVMRSNYVSRGSKGSLAEW